MGATLILPSSKGDRIFWKPVLTTEIQPPFSVLPVLPSNSLMTAGCVATDPQPACKTQPGIS